MKTFFLGIDIGNSHTVIGLFDHEGLVRSWRTTTRTSLTPDELAVLIGAFLGSKGLMLEQVHAVIISSVVPPATDAWQGLVTRYTAAKLIDAHQVALELMKIEYPRPHEIGTDRLINAIAAFHRTKSPTIIVDYGTATTFDCISSSGAYLGGAIAPGITMSVKSLFSGTSKLPLVHLDPTDLKPLGKDTESAIRSGILYGFAGMTDHLIGLLAKDLGQDVKTLATGGLAQLIFPLCTRLEGLAPELTLEGLLLCLRHRLNGDKKF